MPSESAPIIGPARTRVEPALSTQVAPTNAPPHPLDNEWMLRVDGQEYGPYTGRRLEEFSTEGRIEPESEVRRLDGGSWILARTDTTLRAFFPDTSKPPLVVSRRGTDVPPVSAGDRSTVVQVTNNIQQPSYVSPADIGADKSPGVALLLSLFFVGAGQLYNGDVGKGIVMFFACIVLWMILLGWIINLWSMIDAYSRAKTLRNRHHAFLLSTRQT